MKSPGLRATLPALAGPALIVIAVLVVLHDFAFDSRIGQGDVLTFFLPNYCFLGKSLAAGHVPAWNPFVMGGVPFASDPQSGWMYLPPMLLFTVLSCGTAIRWMIVLQPLLGGLGLYAFLRSEGLSRPAATTGGLVLALGVAGSEIAISLPFAGSLGWTAVLLWCASRFLRATRRSSVLLWALAAAATWGQVAGAHLSVGLAMGTGLLAVYMVAAAVARRGPGQGLRRAAAMGGLLVAAMILVNLAVFLPRLAYSPHTSLGLGYLRLEQIAENLGRPALRIQREGATPAWPLAFALTPGAHLGAAALLLAPVAWRARRFRAFVAGASLYGGLLFVGSLRAVASAIPSSWRSLRVVDYYLHRPEWLGYELLIIIAVLAAIGLDAWREVTSMRDRVIMLGPAAALWIVLPLTQGAELTSLWLFATGAAVSIPLLIRMGNRGIAVAAVPAILAVELVVNGFVPNRMPSLEPQPELLSGLPAPTFGLRSLLRAGPIDRVLLAETPPGSRWLGLDPARAGRFPFEPRSTILGTEQVQGYNPVQLQRFWVYTRVAAGTRLAYNQANFTHPSEATLDLLQVGWFVSRLGPPEVPATEVLVQGERRLYRRQDVPAPASFVGAWSVSTGPDAALRAVTADRFDPQALVVLERDPGVGGGEAAGAGSSGGSSVTFRPLGSQADEIIVTASSPGVILVRTPWDRNWHATRDGDPTPVLHADYVDMGMAVPGGRHTIRLTYHDPWIGDGMAGSGLAVATLLAAAAVYRRRERRP